MADKNTQRVIAETRSDIQAAIALIKDTQKTRHYRDLYYESIICDLARWLAMATNQTTQYWVDLAADNAKNIWKNGNA